MCENEEYTEAINYYERAMIVNDKMPDVHYNLANAYFRTKSVDKAIIHYQKAIECHLPDKRPEYFINLGTALSLKRQYDDAIVNFKSALDICGDNTPEQTCQVFINLGNAYLCQS
jgi:tetratricopeptide (TPR) repeat protein